MANKNDKKIEQTEAVEISQPQAPEALYNRSEIKGAASSFGVVPELLAGALSLSDKEQLSRLEVVNLINRFKERKVK